MSYMMCRREEVFSYEIFVPALGSCGRTNKAARSRLPEVEQRPGIELGANFASNMLHSKPQCPRRHLRQGQKDLRLGKTQMSMPRVGAIRMRE